MTKITSIQRSPETAARAHPAARPESEWTYTPAVDILDAGAEFTIIADLPGCTQQDVEVTFENGILTLHGSVPRRQQEGTPFIRQEYGVGDYHRSFKISAEVDPDGITADWSSGVLTVHLPKAARARPRRVQINAA